MASRVMREAICPNRYGQRLCLEAWHINASPCALNRDDGSHLPQEYLHLVGR